MYIVFGGGSLIAVFLFFAFALGYQAFLALRGAIAIITMVVFALVVISTVVVMVCRMRLAISNSGRTSHPILDLVMGMLSSALLLYTSYVTMKELPPTGDGIWDMIIFVAGLFSVGALWVSALAGWLEANIDIEDSFHFKGMIPLTVSAGVLYAIPYVTPVQTVFLVLLGISVPSIVFRD